MYFWVERLFVEATGKCKTRRAGAVAEKYRHSGPGAALLSGWRMRHRRVQRRLRRRRGAVGIGDACRSVPVASKWVFRASNIYVVYRWPSDDDDDDRKDHCRFMYTYIHAQIHGEACVLVRKVGVYKDKDICMYIYIYIYIYI